MTKEFFDKVMTYRTVDTKKYRYHVFDDISLNRMEIKRIPLSYLDTTAALDSWETVWSSDEG